jgi:hypothetical protein
MLLRNTRQFVVLHGVISYPTITLLAASPLFSLSSCFPPKFSNHIP